MKELEKNIIGIGEVKGFLFTQITQSDKAYLYKVNSYYEVFRKKQKTNSKRHCFPTAKAFGILAWTFPSFEKAKAKFNQLNNNTR